MMRDFEIDKDFNVIPKQKEKIARKKQNNLFLIAKYSNIGYYLVAPLILGAFIGFGIDLYFNTKPFFTVLLLIIGVVSTFYNLIKLVRSESK
ncbi:hypothetical protein A3C24_04905 [Candidatus Roizmanbacteria bacterium RIFCSPHIGHO2_02_FULL_37_24]|uniref:ATP synthase subunit n=1 Tax=Candidatus Roizmanbacteria bacterium RIFCSPHIGHO2_02_FULL_37_24 TaxID=1802037 RepID=A0A1F7GXU8_9BACT|nr:MAG: hypothetical protein A3C24_04905 [Candidatus Roizmanbacteria bacterium RIFCSPHIGHO2_02_FULL_37_24]OGK60702.1 MAG: hypothetical protein A3G65_02575 [Candidatus Roizmanbacteria bacterium RIFCSPLOWO2_12_FULL_37_7b]